MLQEELRLRRAVMLAATLAVIACAERDPCPDCDLVVEQVLVLGNTDDDGATWEYPWVSPRLKGGFRLVTSQNSGDASPSRLFDSTGRFVRLVGVIGQGPGEYRYPAFMFALGDTVLLTDLRTDLVTFILPPDSVVRRESWLHPPRELAELHDGSFLIVDRKLNSKYSVKHVARDGTPLSEFGDTLPESKSALRHARFAVNVDGSFWTVPVFERLRLHLWSAPGELVRTIDVDTEHYPSYEGVQAATETIPESPWVTGLWSDSTGVLTLVLKIPDQRWQRGYSEVSDGPHGAQREVSDYRKAYDTVILRVDPQSGAVISERRLDEHTIHVTEPGELVTVQQNSDGFVVATIFRVTTR